MVKSNKLLAHILDECRIVLPGVQTLFGFQLVAVLNQGFEKLPQIYRLIHLLSMILAGIALIAIITPAAYHRLAEPDIISSYMVRVATWAIIISLIFFGLSITTDIYVINYPVTHSNLIGIYLAVTFFIVWVSSWFIFPLSRRQYETDNAI